jgi:hypothetical protein
MRDLSISISYVNKADGGSVILSCAPTIVSDEINRIYWKLGETTFEDKEKPLTSLQLTYDQLKEFASLIDKGKIPIKVTAYISGEGTSDDSSADDFSGTAEIDIYNIFKTSVSYANSDGATKKD